MLLRQVTTHRVTLCGLGDAPQQQLAYISKTTGGVPAHPQLTSDHAPHMISAGGMTVDNSRSHPPPSQARCGRSPGWPTGGWLLLCHSLQPTATHNRQLWQCCPSDSSFTSRSATTATHQNRSSTSSCHSFVRLLKAPANLCSTSLIDLAAADASYICRKWQSLLEGSPCLFQTLELSESPMKG